ncbi:MAG: DNA repair exonuclease [Actinobacteria bacterium]|nr:DNA repair exonuclease [Actinomycetota bacterium]MCG2807807.1 DNA repair exonuclease [Coriobacteriia bacterium]
MARAFTFIHTADLHLDAPFAGIDAADPRVREVLVDSTYAALDRIVSVAVERGVDFVLIAGDAYNSRDKSLRAQLRFKAACERLSSAGVPVFIAQGNHDPADGWTANLTFPQSVRYFATDSVERIEVLDPESGEPLCALYGRGYATGPTKLNLARGFKRESADENAVAVLHANVGGQEGYESYAPCTMDDLRAAGMDYWALGHIHKPSELSDSPRVRYAGSPQGLNPKEDGPHGCWLVTMERGAILAEEFVETSAVRWARSTLDVSGLDSLEAVHTAIREQCSLARAGADGRPSVLRLELSGRTEVHAELARGASFSELVTEIRDEQMGESPWLWVDRIRDTTRGVLDIEFLSGVEDFTGDLVRIAAEAIGDCELSAALLAEALAGVDSAFGARDRDAASLIEQARDVCLDRLIGGDDR